MNLEARIRELHREGDTDAMKQLIRAAISCGNGAEYRFDDGKIRVSHSAYSGTHEVHRRPIGGVRIVARGEYHFVGESGNLDVELDAVNSSAVQFGREHVAESMLGDADPSVTATDSGRAVPTR